MLLGHLSSILPNDQGYLASVIHDNVVIANDNNDNTTFDCFPYGIIHYNHQ